MDFTAWGMNLELWRDSFNLWIDRYIGDGPQGTGGIFRGPLIAFLAITIVTLVVYHGRDFLSRLFNAPMVRNNRVEFQGVAGATWGTDQQVDDLLKMGNYQELSGRKTTREYVSTDEEGNEQSRIKVSRWSSD